jgi:hypothetical protein
MTDHGLRARRVMTLFALVMLAACSQEPAEQAPAKSAPDQSAAAHADCRDEVLAAFRQLKTSGRPYREETITTIDGRTYREAVEFAPPDQVRLSGNIGWLMHAYYVGIGPRAWANWSPFPWGWSEEHPDAKLIQMKLAANADAAAVLNVPPPAYACLGKVEFKGTAYLGYRSRVAWAIARMVFDGAARETRDPELERKLAQMPEEWCTVLVDPASRLPAYDLVAQQNRLDDPRSSVRYTYPNAITIKPPLWCRLGLCGSTAR